MACIYGLRAKNSFLYIYIGSTKYTAMERWKKHQEYIRLGYNRNRHFVNAINKIGVENIAVDVLAECEPSQQFTIEYQLLEQYRALGHPLTNIVYSGSEYALEAQVALYQDYPLRPDHFVTIFDAYFVSLPRTGYWLHDMLCDEIEAIAKYLIDKHFDKYVQMFGECLVGIDCEQEANRQAASLYKRLSAALECG
jgi:hypothetical protein